MDFMLYPYPMKNDAASDKNSSVSPEVFFDASALTQTELGKQGG
jgi:hypothetical protein